MKAGLLLDIEKLKQMKNPVWTEVDGIPAQYLGWGSDPAKNLALRKQLGMPGPPFGGLGLFDPQKHVSEVADLEPLPEDWTEETVSRLKMQQFELSTAGTNNTSMYWWALQPIYDVQDRARSAEILVRARNGSDSAPFEDILALANTEQSELKEVYAKWKVGEIVDFTVHAFKTSRALLGLDCIMVNVRPRDMPLDTLVYQELVRRMAEMQPHHRAILKEKVVIEVTEDQTHPDEFETILQAWKDLGFRLSYDDCVGSKASKELIKVFQKDNLHTTDELGQVMKHFDHIKVDIDWAGYIVFLSHPSYAMKADVKAKVLEHVKEKGTVLIPKGPIMTETNVSHDDLCAELVSMCKAAIDAGKTICIELSVRADDANHAYALNKLKDMGLDIFGDHKQFFSIQGGLTGAKAFMPESLATCVMACKLTDDIF